MSCTSGAWMCPTAAGFADRCGAVLACGAAAVGCAVALGLPGSCSLPRGWQWLWESRQLFQRDPK